MSEVPLDSLYVAKPTRALVKPQEPKLYDRPIASLVHVSLGPSGSIQSTPRDPASVKGPYHDTGVPDV
jgi:hypothetical protein